MKRADGVSESELRRLPSDETNDYWVSRTSCAVTKEFLERHGAMHYWLQIGHFTSAIRDTVRQRLREASDIPATRAEMKAGDDAEIEAALLRALNDPVRRNDRRS